MQSEGLFFCVRDQYTIFLHSRPESQLSLSAAARKFALSRRSTENILFSVVFQNFSDFYLHKASVGETHISIW